MHNNSSYSVSSVDSSQTRIRINRTSISPIIPKPRKRKSRSEIQEAEGKKIRMDEETFKKLLSDQTEQFSKTLAERLDPLTEKLSNVESKCSAIEQGNALRDQKLKDLEGEVSKLKESVKSEVKREISKELESLSGQAHVAFLSREVEKTAANIVVYGLKANDCRKAIEKMFGPKLSNGTSDIKSVTTLGKETEGKPPPPPILVGLSNEFCRNSLLKNLGTLEKGIIVEKDIPKYYREKYKSFKRKAWHLKQFLDVSTQISFQAHILTLRYREGNKGFTIVDEFFPSSNDIIKSIATKDDAKGLPPSVSVNKDNIAIAEKTVLMLGVKGESENSVREVFGMVLSDSKLKLIDNIEIIDSRAKIVCKSPNSAKTIYDSANGKQAGEVKINLALFQ